jgi:hypothetical protein
MRARVDKRRFGPWALITGASSGIGKEFALQIAASVRPRPNSQVKILAAVTTYFAVVRYFQKVGQQTRNCRAPECFAQALPLGLLPSADTFRFQDCDPALQRL